jgi:hypothetical protein
MPGTRPGMTSEARQSRPSAPRLHCAVCSHQGTVEGRPRRAPGTYSAVGAGVAAAGGAKAITLQNSKGVVMQLRGRQAGFEATLGVGGVEVTMQ